MVSSTMRSQYRCNHHLLLSSSLLISLATFAAAQATSSHILNKGSNITDGETLVSANGLFTMGFFAPGVPATRRFLGIWFTATNSSDAVWVANRDHPISDASGVLVVEDTGNLVLLDGSAVQTAWSSNTIGAVSPTLQLLDSGNLVVRDGGSSGGGAILWQSFDHPTNTLLPGMKVGSNLWTATEWSLRSWRAANDPSPGTFRYVLVTRGLPELPEIVIVDSGGAVSYRTGVWNGLWFSGVPTMASYSDMFAYQMTVSPGSEISYGYTAKPGALFSRVVLNSSGVVEHLRLDSGSRTWSTLFQGPRDVCDKYAMCGPSGVCNASAAATSICSCVMGFTPVSTRSWSSGCRRTVPLDCGNTTDGSNSSTDWFAVLQGVKLPDMINSSVDTSITLDQCRARCLANCSCVAYAAADIRGGGDGSGCLMWAENLTDLRYVDGGQTLYLRQARSELGSGKRDNKKRRTEVAGGLLCFILLSVVFLIAHGSRIRRRNLLVIQITETSKTPSVVPIALATVKSATRNFSKRNVIGEGTFGIVYEGKLPGWHHELLQGLAGRTIAVKRLKPISDLPEAILSYFTREMQVMSGLTQHKNVLRLLAYCDEGVERIFVYEYMHRGSLDTYIFGKPKERALLNWQRRLQIVQGIAEGVKHLHEGEGSPGNVIHRDLKPANVLLDGGWTAKVADFGTAKLLPTGATGTRTRMGSPGYMAPEYVHSEETSLKCDVYSFGVTLLETLSGRRNCEAPSLISEAWRLWVERSITTLLDSAVALSSEKTELRQLGRCIQVGLLCIQEKPDDRPSMSAVVEMLSSGEKLAEPTVPMVGSRMWAMFLEADLSRPIVYETIDLT